MTRRLQTNFWIDKWCWQTSIAWTFFDKKISYTLPALSGKNQDAKNNKTDQSLERKYNKFVKFAEEIFLAQSYVTSDGADSEDIDDDILLCSELKFNDNSQGGS